MSCGLLAVDIGTSSCKTAIFDESGKLLASATQDYPVYYPAPGWVEQDAEDWWQAACKGIRCCLEKSKLPPHSIAGIGVDGQSWSCIPVDAQGKVLARTPIWMDTRAEALCAGMPNKDKIFEVSGNPFQPFYTTPKILWFQQRHPELYARTRVFLQSNGFIVYRLTGRYSHDLSQGYGLHVFDIRKKRYDPGLCQQLGIAMEKLPPLFPSHTVVGTVTEAAAAATGLVPGIPVAAGGLDAACGTLGAGVCRPGQTQEQGGQAGGMSICIDHPILVPELILSPHVVPDQWLLQGGTVGGGGSLKWLAAELGGPEQLAAQERNQSPFQLLDELAQGVAPGSDGVVFLPYLAGERSPIWDPQATGVFFGLGYDKTRAHFFRALLEGAAFALRHNLETAEKAGAKADSLYAMGGAANSRLWTQIKADVTGKRILVPDSDTATVRGAAILAGVAARVYGSFSEAVDKTVSIRREHRPDAAHKIVYDDQFEIYLQLYPQLAPVMKRAAAIREKRDGR